MVVDGQRAAAGHGRADFGAEPAVGVACLHESQRAGHHAHAQTRGQINVVPRLDRGAGCADRHVAACVQHHADAGFEAQGDRATDRKVIADAATDARRVDRAERACRAVLGVGRVIAARGFDTQAGEGLGAGRLDEAAGGERR